MQLQDKFRVVQRSPGMKYLWGLTFIVPSSTLMWRPPADWPYIREYWTGVSCFWAGAAVIVGFAVVDAARAVRQASDAAHEQP